jgi:hypothetical protein
VIQSLLTEQKNIQFLTNVVRPVVEAVEHSPKSPNTT